MDTIPYQVKPVQTVRSPLVYRPTVAAPSDAKNSTLAAFGGILNTLSRGDDTFASKIVTTSPDVAVSTNLGAWINQRAIFHRQDRADVFSD